MKTLVLLLLLALPALVDAQAVERDHVKAFRSEWAKAAQANGDDMKKWSIRDTGDDLDTDLGKAPIAEVYRKDQPVACLYAVHPTDPKQSMRLLCYPREPEVEVNQ